MNKAIIIAGPTASGKTALSIRLARDFNCEIVSADSMIVYKGMDIGTAKPTTDEMKGVPHYMIDISSPEDRFNVNDYQIMARECIERIYKKGKIPIIVGGTGLYIDSLIYNSTLSVAPPNYEYRRELEELASAKGNEYVHNMLLKCDEKTAQRLHPNDIRRIIRALEVCKTGRRMSDVMERERAPIYDTLYLCINADRNILYERINNRVTDMLDKGFLTEVISLIKNGYNIYNSNAMKAIGYKEAYFYCRGLYSYAECVRDMMKNSRRYAKRQFVWFKKNRDISWINIDEEYNVVKEKVGIFLQGK